MKNIHLLNMLTARDRWRSVRLVSILALTLLVMVGIITVPHMAGAMYQAFENSTLSVEPAIGNPGTDFTFSAGGFKAGEAVTFWANDPSTLVHSSEDSSTAADSTGQVAWNWTAPAPALDGQWSMVAEGTSSGVQQVIFFKIENGTVTEQTPIEVDAEESPQGDPETNAYADPQSGTPGTVFTFYASGFDDNERVSYWANDPSLTVYSENGNHVGADNGTVSWSWTAPLDAVNGQWSMVAEGMESHVQRIIIFEISGGAVVPVEPTPIAQPVPDEAPTPAVAPDNAIGGEASIEPAAGVPGTLFTFHASGFNPREAVHFWANDPSTHVHAPEDDSVNAAQDGTVSWTWRAPRTAMSGQWAMVIEGVQSQVQYVILFDIQGGTTDPAAPSTLTANPEAGSGGTVFTFYADGFNPREGVTYWLNDPQTQIYTGAGFSLTTDENGQAVWTWQSPESAMQGQWAMVAEGNQSRVQHVILFQITDEPVQQDTGGLTIPENPLGYSASPTVGNTYESLTFSASGFQFRETVSYWANDPGGLVYGDSKYTVRSGSNGTAEWTWQVPEGARPGVWSMVARGAVSGVEYVIYFGVE